MKRSFRLITMAYLAAALGPFALADALPGEASSATPKVQDAAADEPQDRLAEIAAREGDFSLALVDPLIEQGRMQARAGNAAAAEDALRRAQHIIHRNEGVHALRQLEIVELMTELHLARDEPYDAERQQELAMYLAERNYGKDSTEILPALERLEQWYADTGQFFHARRTLERTIDIIARDSSDADPRMIEPLMEQARIRRLQKICCSYKLLEEAREIVETNPQIPGDERAEVYAALGDAYVASGKDDRARKAYRRGWNALDDDIAARTFAEPIQIAMAEDLHKHERANKRVFEVDQDPLGFPQYREMSIEERLGIETRPPQQFFVPLEDNGRKFHIKERTTATNDSTDRTRKMVGQPFQFFLPQLQQILPLSMQDEEDLASVSIDLEFTVKADGRVSDVVIGGDAPAKLKRLMRDVVYKSHFRPRLEEGKPVATENFRLTQTFH